MMRARILATALSVVAAASGRVAHAQLLTGVVRDSASRAPVPGAVVLLVDANGATLRRALTNQSGEWRLALAADGRALRLQRIGFRPRTMPVPNGTAARLELTLTAIPMLLDAVSVVDQPKCSRRADRAPALALWEQARAALLAAVVARDAEDVVVRRFSTYRVVGETRPLVLSQVVHADSARGVRPFASVRTPAEFLSEGYLARRGDERVFHAPDADVLLDPSFVDAYCLRLTRPDRARPTQVGVAFAPNHTAGHVDIEGTLWVDTTARTLASLEFTYLGLDDAERALGPGGTVSFATLPNGAPAIDRWAIRVVNMRASREPNARNLGRSRPDRPSGPLEMHEIGGQLASAAWGDSLAWHAPLGTLRGTLVRGGRPVPGQRVRLVGTDYATTTDAGGAFVVRDLVPGRYAFAVADSALNAVGMELTRGETFTIAGDTTVVARFELPTLRDVAAGRCRGDSAAVTVVGRVSRDSGEPAFGARVVIARRSSDPRRMWTAVATPPSATTTVFRSVYDGALGDGNAFVHCTRLVEQYHAFAQLGRERGEATSSLAPRQVVPLSVVLAPIP